MGAQNIIRTTHTQIGKTVYVVTAIQSEKATETVNDKLKRILCRKVSDPNFPIKKTNENP